MGIFIRFIHNQDGATAIEYGLIAAGIFGRNYRNRPGARNEPEHHIHQCFDSAEITL
jgi:hypothetical protein